MFPQPLPQARSTDLIVQSIEQETIVIDSRTNKAYVLNPTAAAVWHACDGKRTVPQLAAHLSQSSPTSEQVVMYALGQLNDLLEAPAQVPQEFVGISRRRFLNLAGVVAAGVAIPVVISMTTPAPAQAQSGGCCVCVTGASTNVPTCTLCIAFCTTAAGVQSCDCDV